MVDLGALAAIAFGIGCLLSLVIWKVRPGTSPLTGSLAAIVSALWASSRIEEEPLSVLRLGAVATGAFAAFVYMEWRGMNRPPVSRLSRKAALVMVGVVLAAVVVGLGVLTLSQWKQDRAMAEQAERVRCASGELPKDGIFSDRQLDAAVRACWPGLLAAGEFNLHWWRSRVKAHRAFEMTLGPVEPLDAGAPKIGATH